MADALTSHVRAYRSLLGSRLRAQASYRTGFVLDVLGNIGFGVLEVVEIYVIFHNVDVLGGLDLGAALLLFALSNIAFSLADLVVGHCDTIPQYLRAGTLDAMLLRPLPLLAQLITSDISLKRLGRTGVALVCLAVAVPLAGIDWSPAKVALLVVTPLLGALVFSALFVAAGGIQFWLVEGREFANAFTYGGSYVASYPTSVLHIAVRTFFSFVVPAAFVAYLPTLALLDLPGPPWLPSWLGWCTPVMVVVVWAWALLLWRAGVRRYTGAGG